MRLKFVSFCLQRLPKIFFHFICGSNQFFFSFRLAVRRTRREKCVNVLQDSSLVLQSFGFFSSCDQINSWKCDALRFFFSPFHPFCTLHSFVFVWMSTLIYVFAKQRKITRNFNCYYRSVILTVLFLSLSLSFTISFHHFYLGCSSFQSTHSSSLFLIVKQIKCQLNSADRIPRLCFIVSFSGCLYCQTSLQERMKFTL